MRQKPNTWHSAILMMAILLVTATTAWARPYRVAIVPFQINSERDLAFLRDGIADMLASRLSWEGRVSVLNKEETALAAKDATGAFNEIQAQILGAKMGADYVLFGSLTIFGDSVSMDAKMIDVSGSREPVSFYNVTQGMGQVIPKINAFASQINHKIFGRAMPAGPAPLPAPTTAAPQYSAPVAVAQPAQAPLDSRAHPERIFESSFGQGVQAQGSALQTGQVSALNPAFTVSRSNQAGRDFWKSQTFGHLINGMDLGDVNGDGKIDTVIVSQHRIHIFCRQGERLQKIFESEEYDDRYFIGVDIGDINLNGKPEIFLSALDILRKRVKSMVMEFNGTTFAPISDDSPYYFRVSQSDTGSILLGQRHAQGGPFKGKIFEMSWEGGSYEPSSRAVPSKNNSLIGLAYGDIQNNGSQMSVAFDDSDHLMVIGPGDKEHWKGGDYYGGSNVYFVLPKDDQYSENWQFLPIRLRVLDVDGDGQNELLTAQNKDFTGKKLKSFRKYTKGHLEALSWSGLGLSPNWKTPEVSGHIQDFAVADFDNDGKNELVAVIIMRDGAVIGISPKSALISYDLKQ